MDNLLKNLKLSFLKLWYPKKVWFEFVTDKPSSFNSRIVYLEGHEIDDLWFAYLKCPCGCDELIMLNLIPDTKPCWKYVVDVSKKQSIFPSINRTQGCRSHFWIRQNKIIICD